jgi:cytochrome c oxidase subunit 3
MSKTYHGYHLVDNSPWPILGAISALTTAVGAAMSMHHYKLGVLVLLIGLISVFYTMFVWWRDVIRESTYEGHHTIVVQRGLRYGMLLFILSEVMFFLAFFWAFFHASLSPAIEIGSIWPPKGIHVFNPWEVPFLNTCVLVFSGATCTWAHEAIRCGDRKEALIALSLTVILGLSFTGLQVMEYAIAPFNISDSVYGSTFYMTTGFHGAHVIIGTVFLSVCLLRVFQYHFTTKHHFGFEAAAWYWHFVDVVWMFLFICIYWWGGTPSTFETSLFKID